jgi:hypothetical protein
MHVCCPVTALLGHPRVWWLRLGNLGLLDPSEPNAQLPAPYNGCAAWQKVMHVSGSTRAVAL